MVNQVKINEAEEAQEESVDTSDPVQINTARKKAARTRAERLEFVHAAMTTQQGRAWFYDLMVRCKTFSTPFTDDPYMTANKCGMQNIGFQILDDIQTAAPEYYLTMITENKVNKYG